MPSITKWLVTLLLLATQGRPGIISGKLISADGSPVSGIRVVAIDVNDAGPDKLAARTSFMNTVQTDTLGAFRMDSVLPGTYYVVADPLGYPTYYPGSASVANATPITVAAGTTATIRDFPLIRFNWSSIVQTVRHPAQTRDSRYYGKIVTAWASDLANVTVILSEAKTGARRMTVTDSGGAFEFPALPAGSYSVELLSAINDRSAPQGFEHVTADVVLKPSEDMQQDFKLRMITGNANMRQPAPKPTRPDLYVAATRPQPPPAGAPPRRSVPAQVLDRTIRRDILPVYPQELWDAKVEGVISLECIFAVDGSVVSLRVVNPYADPVFARAAVAAVSQWHYSPPDPAAERMEYTGTLVLPFTLNDR
jgi:TonB family protein